MKESAVRFNGVIVRTGSWITKKIKIVDRV
jgi:hypothetical protein